jgi:HEPN domain-containing protein
MPDRFYDFYDFPSWITEDWQKFYDLAESYKKSIKQLLYNESHFQEGIYSERDILPILFLFRHYLELTLKSLLLQKQAKVPMHHKIKDLLSEIKKLNTAFKFSKQSSDFIDWIISQDEDGYKFRYPVDTKMNENFVSDNKNVAKGVSLSYVSINIHQIFTEIERIQSPNPTN